MMHIEVMKELLQEVKPYDRGTHTMWTDPHIANYLLACHLDSDSGAASRNTETIETTVDWIVREYGRATGHILDLGCGPGLYTSRLAKMGYDVTGVDFSRNSINHGKAYALEHGLSIHYICGDYLDVDIEGTYDMIMMIYCDFGVLIPEDRDKLISRIHGLLKPGGIFIFDGLDDMGISQMTFDRSWGYHMGGFWQPQPFLCLTESLHYPDYKALLDQHVIINESGEHRIYRFWNHYYNVQDVKKLFYTAGFDQVRACQDLLHGEGAYNGKHVTFYTVRKSL